MKLKAKESGDAVCVSSMYIIIRYLGNLAIKKIDNFRSRSA